MSKKKKMGLVLSGGGARGAYQVGVLQALGHICSELNIKSPFQIYSGVSAGSINAAFMASYAHDFSRGAEELSQLWSNLKPENIFKSDVIALGKKLGMKFVDFSFGQFTQEDVRNSLLDTSPLKDLLQKNLNLNQLRQNIENKNLEALAVTAMDYHTSQAVSFIQGNEHLPQWSKPRRKSVPTSILPEHIMASSAIPLLFPPIRVEDRYYGDGCVRNTTPCSPTLRLGAEKIFVVGVRRIIPSASDLKALHDQASPSMIRIINVLLNTVLLDGIEHDIERINRINEMVSLLPKGKGSEAELKRVDYIWVSPSGDIGEIASERSTHLPRMLRFFLKTLGHIEDAHELVSYLLFESNFCKQLIEMGYQDGLEQRDSIIHFLQD